ncbi:hypothetical protein RM844_28400 [Streptomyces sp. DSM 44915]|uniref:Uncharacterized protein n=1 Tax=Streptomyces chisholmiae TaxID=3075540 RepID=A0ABU2JYW2_9ACTN|nr:hypothetical protein [Streptomyces sp. DSM 44915]MDT0270198.1 hypothetical protein [Streptomyces sp. DSM 44915]
MAQTYTLTLHNRSTQPGFDFVVYAVVPILSGLQGARPDGSAPGRARRENAPRNFPLAWQARPVPYQEKTDFCWSLDYSLVYASVGCRAGAAWSAAQALPVSADDRNQNTAQLTYAGDAYVLSRKRPGRPPDPPETYLETSATVPHWSQENGPSVGVAITTGPAGRSTPALVTDSGPNLLHVATLRPAYYIWAGQQDPGTQTDLATVLGHQQVTFDDGAVTAEWTLDADNRWIEGAPPPGPG